MLTLQHRNKPLMRGWEGKAGRKAASPRESLAGRRIWPWKKGSRAGLDGDITKHPHSPGMAAAPPFPPRISKVSLMLSFLFIAARDKPITHLSKRSSHIPGPVCRVGDCTSEVENQHLQSPASFSMINQFAGEQQDSHPHPSPPTATCEG